MISPDATAAGEFQRVTVQVKVLVLGAHARMADDLSNHRGRKPVWAVSSDTLKSYTGLLPSREAIHMTPHGRHLAGSKASVSLPGPSVPASVRQGR